MKDALISRIMRHIFILTLCLVQYSHPAVSQSKILTDYDGVNIDSLVKSPFLLPPGKKYTIKKIRFSVSIDQIKDLGETGGIFRDRFIQLNKLSPDQHWQYKFGSITFKIEDTWLTLVLSNGEQFDKVLALLKTKAKKNLIIYAQMLIGKFERYDTTRDFQAINILIGDHRKMRCS